MASCAKCNSKPCRSGKTEGALADCPNQKYSPESLFELYSDKERYSALQSATTEREGYCRDTRIEEIMDYAYKMQYKRLGLAFCVGLSSEAKIVSDIFQANGFDVDSVCCKCGMISKEVLGITRDEFVRPQNEYEGMCNPIGQAKILDDLKVDFVVLLGLCVGHDTLFVKHVEAPCTVLAVKDRAMGNNPLAAVYTANNYSGRVYGYIEKKYGRK